MYSVHPAVAYARAIIENMPAMTGRSIDEWVALVQDSGENVDRRQWLKDKYGIGGTRGRMIINRAAGKGEEDTDPEAYLAKAVCLVENMYAGPKSALRPIHDRLIELSRALGEDVRICPCKTIVPLYREHVFAEIKPATRKRIDFGLAFRMHEGHLPDRVLATGGLEKGDRITHRFALTSIEEVDDEVALWLKTAYELKT